MAIYTKSVRTFFFFNPNNDRGRASQYSQRTDLSVATEAVGARLTPRAGASQMQFSQQIRCLPPRLLISTILNIFGRGFGELFRNAASYAFRAVYTPAAGLEPAPCGFLATGAGVSDVNGLYVYVGPNQRYENSSGYVMEIPEFGDQALIHSGGTPLYYEDSADFTGTWQVNPGYSPDPSPAPTVTDTCV